MTPIRRANPALLNTLFVAALDLLFLGILLGLKQYGPIHLHALGTAFTPVSSYTDITLWMIRATFIFACLVLGRNEIALLFRRPAGTIRNMGTGLGRVSALARTTMLEAWAGRIWLLPVL